MTRVLRPIFFLAAIMCAAPAQAQLGPLAGTYRPLVVLAATDDTPALADIRILARQARAALADRDVIVVTVAGDAVSLWDPAGERAPKVNLDAGRLRQAFGSGAPFEMVLIGKDKTVKSRTRTPTDLQSMLALIDTMPMRQRELKARAQEAERRRQINERMFSRDDKRR